MQDDFLKAFTEQRRLRVEQDRSFEIDGVTLTHRAAVAPEIPLRFAQATEDLARWADDVNRLLAAAKNGDTPDLPEQPIGDAELIAVYDAVCLSCLEPSSHEAWAELRSPDAPYPITGDDLYRLTVYLLGKATALPTDGLLGSSSTQPETSTTSKENSPSPVRKRKTSAQSS